MHRLVETELFFDIGDDGGVKSLCTAITTVATRLYGAGSLYITSLPCESGSRINCVAAKFGENLLHWPTWCELDYGKVDHHDAQQGGHDQQQPSKNISEHVGTLVGQSGVRECETNLFNVPNQACCQGSDQSTSRSESLNP